MAARDSNKGKKDTTPSAPAWMVTFSDMVTLLLTFFVLMLSMARLDQVKFKDAAGSLRDAFGVMQGGSSTDFSKPRVVHFAAIEDDFVSRLYQRLNTDLNRLKIDRKIKLVKDRGAIVLRIDNAIIFGSGEVTVKEDAYPVLRDVASLIDNLPLHLRIEGHTDGTPSSSADFTNWDISVARAISVLKFFEKEKLITLDRMSAVGYGSQRPLVEGDSPEAKAMNRRVEFVLESIGSHREALPYLMDARDQLPF